MNDDEKIDEMNNVEPDDDDEDLMLRISQIISEACFVGVTADMCEIPSTLLVNRDLVAGLKESLMTYPDKCQCLVGVVAILDNKVDKKRVGQYQVYVNPELFVALQELSFEGIDFYGDDRIPAVVHSVTEDEALGADTLGIFLNKNSKEFSSKMREGMIYQDLLRFCCLTVENQGKGQEVKMFIKKALKDIGKGKQNTTVFLSFAMLPPPYLNKFESFLRLFESGSLHGQKLSSRKLCNVDKNWNKKKECKLEVPRKLLKQHLNISQVKREKLIDDLLSRQIDFSQYCACLKLTSEISDVKKTVEIVSKSKFCEAQEKCPEMFADHVLQDFAGARVNQAGQNAAYNRLVKHVNLAFSEDKSPAEASVDRQQAVCSESDSLNLLTLGRKMKSFDVIICGLGKDSKFNQDNLMCMEEQVKCELCVGIVINHDEKTLSELDMQTKFEGTAIVFDFIYVKRDTALASNGFQKELQTIAVFGNKACFLDKQIKTFYNSTIKDVIPSLISDVVDVKKTVLYTFSEPSQAFDVDQLGILARKKIAVEYLAKKAIWSLYPQELTERLCPNNMFHHDNRVIINKTFFRFIYVVEILR